MILVSNREPYIHDLGPDGKVRLIVPASGLVSALEPVTRACAGTWIAHGGGSADRMTVDEHDRIEVPPNNPSYTLRRVWLSEEEVQGYYLGFANDGLWPLCHIVFTRPVFRASDWETYRAVNQKFARIEQIKKFKILPRDLSQEEGELTPTLKVKRGVVYKKYAPQVEELYEGSSSKE